MKHKELEQYLDKRIWRQRIIGGAITAGSFVVAIVCLVLREDSREVIVHDLGLIKYEEIVYNNTYVPFVLVGFLIAFMGFWFVLGSFIMCRHDTVEISGHYLTVYIGMGRPVIYVDGAEVGRPTFSHYMETAMPDGTVATVSFGRSIFAPCHISFSGGHKSVDI